MLEKDRKFLTRMLESAKEATTFAEGKTRQDLDEDKQLTLSLLISLEMIAQAASKVSRDCQEGCEPIPWEEVIDMKQNIVHTYWDIDRDWIWERVTKDLPGWVVALELLLESK